MIWIMGRYTNEMEVIDHRAAVGYASVATLNPLYNPVHPELVEGHNGAKDMPVEGYFRIPFTLSLSKGEEFGLRREPLGLSSGRRLSRTASTSMS